MVDVKPGPHAEHVNPMPHGGFDVAYHIPILDNPAKEPTHAVSPCAIATPQAYGNGVTSAYPFERCVVVERSARTRYPLSSSTNILASRRLVVSKPTMQDRDDVGCAASNFADSAFAVIVPSGFCPLRPTAGTRADRGRTTFRRCECPLGRLGP